jgi:ribosomal protein S6
MSRDRSKEQSYYSVTVWFKHGTKKYNISTFEKLDEFLSKADFNDTVLHYMVVQVSNWIYPEYMSNKYKKLK